VAPSFLDIPESALKVLVPRAPQMGRTREQLLSRTSPVFDALGAAGTAADLALRLLLDPARAARMVDFHRRNSAAPDFSELLAAATERIVDDGASLPAREREIGRLVQRELVDRLESLSADGDASPGVRSRADQALSNLLQRIDAMEPEDEAQRAHFDALVAEIGRHLARPAPAREPSRAAQAEPPGEPIGAGYDDGGLAGCSLDDRR